MFSEIFKPIYMQDKFNINNTSFKHSELNKNRVQIMCTLHKLQVCFFKGLIHAIIYLFKKTFKF